MGPKRDFFCVCGGGWAWGSTWNLSSPSGIEPLPPAVEAGVLTAGHQGVPPREVLVGDAEGRKESAAQLWGHLMLPKLPHFPWSVLLFLQILRQMWVFSSLKKALPLYYFPTAG